MAWHNVKRVCLIHDNAQLHVAAETWEKIDSFGWNFLDHPPYSPDISPSDYHLFPKLKEFSGGDLESDGELKSRANRGGQKT